MNRKNEVYKSILDFKGRHGGTIAWRLKAHSRVVESHLNDDETVLYSFAAQKGLSPLDIASTYIVVVTEKRLIVAQRRLFFGYFYYSITPEMFNDLTIKMGLIWGKVIIDTVKETVTLSYISKAALQEIETVISKYMIQKKRLFEAEGTEEDDEKLEEELYEISKNGEK